MDLDQIRKDIDQIDQELVALLEMRPFKLSFKI